MRYTTGRPNIIGEQPCWPRERAGAAAPATDLCRCQKHARHIVDNSARSFIDIHASRPARCGAAVLWPAGHVCVCVLAGHRAPIMCERAYRSVNISSESWPTAPLWLTAAAVAAAAAARCDRVRRRRPRAIGSLPKRTYFKCALASARTPWLAVWRWWWWWRVE